MLSVEQVLEIRWLLDEGGLSQRVIADRLGVGRGTVGAIANGRRGLYGRNPAWQPPPQETTAVPQRCRGCGGLVYEPCLLCRARACRRREEELWQLLRSVRSVARKYPQISPQRASYTGAPKPTTLSCDAGALAASDSGPTGGEAA